MPKGEPNWRIARYADDPVILVHGTRHDGETLREDTTRVLAPLSLRLSEAKTRVAHVSEGLDLLGFRVQWRRKRGTSKWYVCTFIADRAFRVLEVERRPPTPHRPARPVAQASQDGTELST